MSSEVFQAIRTNEWSHVCGSTALSQHHIIVFVGERPQRRLCPFLGLSSVKFRPELPKGLTQ